MKPINIKKVLSAFVIAVSFVLAFYFYPRMPQVMVTHWGIDGQPNGYSPKTLALFLMPGLSLFLFVLFLFLPKTDPYRKNFKQFSGYFDTFVLLVLLFLLYIYIMSLAWGLNYRFNMIQYLAPAFAVLYFYAGVLMSKAKRNWFVGIRTPWTMASETVWKRTHKLGSKFFKAAGLIAILSLIWPGLAFTFIIIPVLLITVFIFVYSYWEYRNLA